MPIVAPINSHRDLYEEFRLYGRQDQFSSEAFEALFDYLEEYSDSTGEPYTLDVIGLCCEWSEEHYKDIAQNYSIDLSECADEDEAIEVVEEYLSDNTQVISLSDGKFLYVNF